MTRTNDLGLLEREAVLRAGTGGELIVASGADRSRFLNGIVTGNVAGTPVGGGCLSALLTPKGHVVTDMRLFVRESDFWIVVDAGQAETVAGTLSRYAIMDDFVAAPRPDIAFASLLGPAAAARLAAAGADPGVLATAPPLAHAQVATADGDLWIARVRELGSDGFWLGAPPAVLDAVQARLAAGGTPELEPAAAEAARIAALEPRFVEALGVDLGEARSAPLLREIATGEARTLPAVVPAPERCDEHRAPELRPEGDIQLGHFRNSTLRSRPPDARAGPRARPSRRTRRRRP